MAENEDTEEYFIENEISVWIWKICSPILLIVGSFGNVLTILVLAQRKNRNSTTATYLIALSSADLLVLWTGLSRQWMIYMFDFDVSDSSVLLCKVQLFLVNVGVYCSSWILVGVTMERFICVWKPHRVKQICTQNRVVLVIVVITVCMMLLNLHYLVAWDIITVEIDNNTVVRSCDTDYDNFYTEIWWKIDLCIVSLIPSVFLFSANLVVISHIVFRQRKLHLQVQPDDPSCQSNNCVRSYKRIKLLVVVNFVFVLCTSPVSIFFIMVPITGDSAKSDHALAVESMCRAVMNILMYLNNTLNFFLYFLSGSRFREQVKAMFRGNKNQN